MLALCVTMCASVLKIFFYAFTSYSRLIIALHKYTVSHKYWILENWRIARRKFYIEIVSIILKRPWAVAPVVYLGGGMAEKIKSRIL